MNNGKAIFGIRRVSMEKEEIIVVKDGLNVIQKRQLLEITRGMINGLNVEEFMEICRIYERATERLLDNKN